MLWTGPTPIWLRFAQVLLSKVVVCFVSLLCFSSDFVPTSCACQSREGSFVSIEKSAFLLIASHSLHRRYSGPSIDGVTKILHSLAAVIVNWNTTRKFDLKKNSSVSFVEELLKVGLWSWFVCFDCCFS